MTTPTWPATLPDFVLRDGFREGFPDRVIRTPMDAGPQKARPRFTAAPISFQMPMSFTGDQLTEFKTFFNDDLAGGALSFIFSNPRTEESGTFRFTSEPEPASATGPDTYLVNLPLEMLP